MILYLIEVVLKVLGIVVPLLLAVAYFTLAERKMLSAIQRRQGPNVVGIYGLTQALADGLKLFVKESIIPSSANSTVFLIAPIVTFMLSLMAWGVMPMGMSKVFSDLNVGVLYLFAI